MIMIVNINLIKILNEKVWFSWESNPKYQPPMSEMKPLGYTNYHIKLMLIHGFSIKSSNF